MTTTRISDAASALLRSGDLTKQTAERLSQCDRETTIPRVEAAFEDPVFSCFLIDASGSMKPFRDSVIESHPELISPLRQSKKCRKNALYIGQWLFSSRVVPLHSPTLLNRDGKDQIALLDKKVYDPQQTDRTALYKTLHVLLQEMVATISTLRNDGIVATFTVGIITDGKDNEGGFQPEDIRGIVQDFKSRKYLRQSVIIGLTRGDFTEEQLGEIKTRIGFDEAISLTQSPKDIRRAFSLASQSAQSAQ